MILGGGERIERVNRNMFGVDKTAAGMNTNVILCLHFLRACRQCADKLRKEPPKTAPTRDIFGFVIISLV